MLELNGGTKSIHEEILKFARWMYDSASCLCRYSDWTPKLHQSICAGQRNELRNTKGCELTNRILSALFAVGGDGIGRETIPTYENIAGSERRNRLHSNMN